jgi:arylsulfatase A-like enzyme
MLKGRHGAGKLELDTTDPKEIRAATYQKFLKDYLRGVAAIDENMGRMLEYLDGAGLAEDTVLIYTSDQGYFLGEHNYFDKRFMLEESLRMPFVVRYPREIRPGTVLDDIILNVDFAETFLDYAGATPPESMQGRSFRANLAGATPADWRDAMYYRYYGGQPQRPAHFGIRTQDAKLIYYDGLQGADDSQRWEFYDLRRDPHETRNIYDDVRETDRVRQYQRRLEELQTELGDRP